MYHANCIGIAPNNGLSPKNYSASFTSLAGQGSNSNATFESCKSFGGTNDYSAVSQQDGYTATLRIHKPTVRDDSSILSILKGGSNLVEYKP